jgi:hypothetical protein
MFNFPVYAYQEILLTNFRCTFLVVSLSLLQSLHPNIDIIFLLFVLQYILIIGNVEVNPGPELINHSSVGDNSKSNYTLGDLYWGDSQKRNVYWGTEIL